MSVAKVTLTIDTIRKRLLSQSLKTTQTIQDLSHKYLYEDPATVFENGTFKTSTVSLGTDPRVGSQPNLIPPTISSAEIKLDGLFNPYVNINFQIPRNIVDGNKVVAFRIYRKSIKADELNQNIEAFTKSDFDQISQNTTRRGKFSQERKAEHDIDASQQPSVSINPNLFDLQQTQNSQQLGAAVSAGTSLSTQFSQQNLQPDSQGFTRIAQVNYADQQQQSLLKQVYVKNDAVVTAYYEDHSVTYGSSYTYAVTAYCKTSAESGRSTPISMVVLNLDGIKKPLTFSVKQLSATSVQIISTFDPKDKIKKAFIFRKAAEETHFTPFDEWYNSNNRLEIVDDEVVYLTTYTYRIILS